MTWLTVLFAIESGLLSGHTSLWGNRVPYPDNATYLTIEVDAQGGPVFVSGSIETQAVPLESNGVLPGFSPYHAVYVFSAGLRFGAFEVGWRHKCVHDIAGGLGIGGGYDRLYVRGEFSLQPLDSMR